MEPPQHRLFVAPPQGPYVQMMPTTGWGPPPPHGLRPYQPGPLDLPRSDRRDLPRYGRGRYNQHKPPRGRGRGRGQAFRGFARGKRPHNHTGYNKNNKRNRPDPAAQARDPPAAESPAVADGMYADNAELEAARLLEQPFFNFWGTNHQKGSQDGSDGDLDDAPWTCDWELEPPQQLGNPNSSSSTGHDAQQQTHRQDGSNSVLPWPSSSSPQQQPSVDGVAAQQQSLIEELKGENAELSGQLQQSEARNALLEQEVQQLRSQLAAAGMDVAPQLEEPSCPAQQGTHMCTT